MRAGVNGLDHEVEPFGGPAARPGGVRGQQARDRQGRLHRRREPVLPHDAQQLGPEAARGLRQHRRPGLGRHLRRASAQDAGPPAQRAPQDLDARRKTDLAREPDPFPTRRAPAWSARLEPPCFPTSSSRTATAFRRAPTA
ncbi:hypothetical protein VARIO8X_60081 [Burkholderiales bacterium 8X]|nr:hypothetical protein VARIO8X_60081 [Burkholderiales bacterium 8X]